MTRVIAVAKIGKDVTQITDPNDFVFHSDFNGFKIILEATVDLTLAASTNNQSFTTAHGLAFTPLVRGFAKEDSVDTVFAPNSENVSAWSGAHIALGTGVKFNYIKSDATNVTFNFDNTNGSTKSVHVRFFCLEDISITPGTSVPGSPRGNKIVIAKPNYNVLTETSPRNLKFSSDYGTLKYFSKQSQQVQLDAAVEVNQQQHGTYTHNLGYYPYVEAFVNVYIGSPAGDYEPCPFFGSGATVLYNAKYIVTKTTVELYVEINGVSSSLWNFDFILFLYRNNLQL